MTELVTDAHDTRQLQLLRFSLFLSIHLTVLLGNGLIITVVACNHNLHIPMYFFLLNLSVFDLGAISVTIPRSISNSIWNTRVRFDGVGGLSEHIAALKEMVILPLLYPEVFEKLQVQPPRGCLFYGPPGTGKTLVARALANECSQGARKISFFLRKGADALSKWLGESERQLRLLFEQAHQSRPSIIFFDEIDGLAPVRSSRQDQTYSSIVSTLLALMDGLDSRGEVVVIGATNRLDSIDPALRRPGRFDREFLFRLPDKEARKEIFKIHTRNWTPKPLDTLLEELAEKSVGYCGADIKAACAEAALRALRRRYPQIYKSTEKLQLDASSIKITAKDFVRAMEKMVPASQRSVSSPAQALSPIVKPLLKKTWKRILQALQRVFPHLFATSNVPYMDLQDEVQELFIEDYGEVFHTRLPTKEERRNFFEDLILNQAAKPPVSRKEAAWQALEVLPLAPPPEPRKPTQEEMQQTEEQEEESLRELRIFLRDVTHRLTTDRRFKAFTKPVDLDEVPDYTRVIKQPMDLSTIASKIDLHQYLTAGDFLKDIDLICSNALEYNPDREPGDRLIRHRACSLRDVAYAIVKAEMDQHLEQLCKEIKEVRFDGVGGLSEHIAALKEMVILPLLYPEVFEKLQVQPPRGCLFYGPPGTGKTLVARALANECSQGARKISFFLRKGADALSKWLGESERQLRLLFEQAHQSRPSIIFFDEIDGLAPVRSSRQDQTYSSIVSTLLALMDGLDSRGEVVVIGATNRLDSIDPALRRPGRFDREFLFRLPDKEARKEIFKIHTRNWTPKPLDTLLEELAEKSVGYCGADIKAACAEAALRALRRRYPQIYKSTEKLQLDASSIKITAKDFVRAMEKMVPASQRSVSSPAQALSPIVKPLLKKTLKRILQALQRVFPHAELFIEDYGEVFHTRLPTKEERRNFFEDLILNQAAKPPVSRKEAAWQALEVLPLAPPPEPRKPTQEEMQQIEEQEEESLRELRIFLRDVTHRLTTDRRFKAFTKPVDLDEVPDYTTVIKQPMDLSTIASKIDLHQYLTAGDFLKDIDLICSNALEYNPDREPGDRLIRHRACSLRDVAYAIVKAEMDQHLEQLCKEIKEARKKR
ncbi:putative cell division cycle ATPase, partial [Eudromia elegans]